MAVRIDLKDDEFFLAGGMLRKPTVFPWLSVANGKKFVKMIKKSKWLTRFATGKPPQAAPLSGSNVLENIKKLVRDNARARMKEFRDSNGCTEAAAVLSLIHI